MNLEEWNHAIFEEAVARTGRPGDPLYLYVDEDTLAAASKRDPDAAVADFCAAFNRIACGAQLQRANQLARHWELDGCPGRPPFVYALAMTVLAVAMPPIGGGGNVYARQRQLLGLSDHRAGIPAGYAEQVPALWQRWNRWLENEGRRFGTVTAHPGHLPYQGWARSQSFIRSVDKEDVLAYFETVDVPNDAEVPEERLLQGLRRWLNSTPSLNRKLLSRLHDADLEDEFKSFLRSAWASWSRDVGLARSGPARRVRARLFWDDDSERFDLILDVSEGSHLLAGKEATALDGLPYQPGPIVYLTPESWEIEQWFDSGVDGWEIAPGIAVEWEPKDVYLLKKVPFAGFVETDVDRTEPGGIVLFADTAADRVESAHVIGSLSQSPIRGWSWVLGAGLADADIGILLGAELKNRNGRWSCLSGGLPLRRGHVFLERGEPDVVIDRPTEIDSVRVDSHGVDLKELVLEQATSMSAAGDEVALDGVYRAVLPLVHMYLDPGDHSVEVRGKDGTTAVHRFTTQAPARARGYSLEDLGTPTPPIPVGLLTDGGGDALTLRVQREAVFLVAEDGSQHWSIECPRTEPHWLHELGLDEAASDYVYIEVSDLPRPVPGPLLLVARLRSRPREVWQVVRMESREGSSRLSARPMPDGIGALAGFIAASPEDIRSDGNETFKRARQGLMNHRADRRAHQTPRVSTRENAIAAGAARARPDVARGRSDENPYNEFLEWLAEREEGRIGYRSAVDAFGWLWRRRMGTAAPDHREVIGLLETLGHVQHDRRRQLVRVAPTLMSSVPGTGGLRVLAGARPVELLEALESGDAPPDVDSPRVGRFLQNIEQHWFSFSRGGAHTAPDALFLRHLAASPEHLGDSNELGIDGRVDTVGGLLDVLPTMDERLAAAESVHLEPSARVQVWMRGPGISDPIGRWRTIRGVPEAPRMFTKLVGSRQSRYAAWVSGGFLQMDWVFGRWWYETRVNRRHDLLYFQSNSRELLIAAEMPRPAILLRAMAASSGLPPRTARTPGNNVRYLVFENVTRAASERAAAILGVEIGAGFSTISPLQFEGDLPA